MRKQKRKISKNVCRDFFLKRKNFAIYFSLSFFFFSHSKSIFAEINQEVKPKWHKAQSLFLKPTSFSDLKKNYAKKTQSLPYLEETKSEPLKENSSSDIQITVISSDKKVSNDSFTFEEEKYDSPVSIVPQYRQVKSTSTPTHIVFKLNSEGFIVSPKKLNLSRSQKYSFSVENKSNNSLQVFSRDERVIKVDRKKKFFVPLANQASEIYVISGENFNIIPVGIEEPSKESSESLLAIHNEAQKILAANTTTSFTKKPSTNIFEKSQISQAAERLIKTDNNLRWSSFDRSPTSFTLQVIDDRSSLGQNEQKFPLPSVLVKVLGTDFSSYTDAHGKVKVEGLPLEANLTVLIDDPYGRVQNGAVSLNLQNENLNLPIKVKALRHRVLQGLASLEASVYPAEKHGSICLNITDEKFNLKDGLRLTINTQDALGPFYTDPYGFPKDSEIATSQYGRACFFNVLSGKRLIGLFDMKGTRLKVIPIHVFEGRHTEEDVIYSPKNNSQLLSQTPEDNAQKVKVGLLSSAQEQFSSNKTISSQITFPEQPELVNYLGENISTLQEDEDQKEFLTLKNYSTEEGLLINHPDFEPTLHRLRLPGHQDNQKAQKNTVPIIIALPRGFMEDTANLLGKDYFSDLGSMFISGNFEEETLSGDQEKENILVQVINSKGEPTDNLDYISGKPSTKIMVRNLEPDEYTVKVTNTSGKLLDLQTITVVNGYTSVLQVYSQPVFEAKHFMASYP